jgi:carbon monoxide dehydrogenase subunit G
MFPGKTDIGLPQSSAEFVMAGAGADTPLFEGWDKNAIGLRFAARLEGDSMDFTGRYAIDAPPQKVWDGLNDPAILKICIPGCEQLDKTSPTDFIATARLKIGPLSATFKGKVTLSDLDPPHRCKIGGEGQGGVAGFAKGTAEVVLAPDGTRTVLTYSAKASVGGRLAQIGQRLIDGAAKQIADDFFKRFATALAAPVLVPDPEVRTAATQARTSKSVPRRRAGLPSVVWTGALIVGIAILLLLFAVKL